MEASTPLSNMPNEIIRHILLQLPMKALIRCQCVCKEWRSLIDGSDFKLSYRGQRRVIFLSPEYKSLDDCYRFLVRSTSHGLRLQEHKWPLGEAYPLIRESDVRVLCSCNGFVLLLADSDILLWNPSTRCSTKVLNAPFPHCCVLAAGLCYDSNTRDYKAVLLRRGPHEASADISAFLRRIDGPVVISASLTNREWRPVQFPDSLDFTRGGVDFRGTFHLWISDIKCPDRNKIMYFDPVHDEFRILPTPKKENPIVGLRVIDDCLCMATCILHKEEQPKTMQVLIMKEYGRQESWMTAFAIQMPQLEEIICSRYELLTFYSQKTNTQEKEVLFLRSFFLRHLYVYDRKKDQLKEVLRDFRRNFASMCFYVESLACLPLPCNHMIN